MVIFTAKPTAICIFSIAWQPSRVVEWKQARLRGPLWTPGGFGGESGPLVPRTGPQNGMRRRPTSDGQPAQEDRRLTQEDRWLTGEDRRLTGEDCWLA